MEQRTEHSANVDGNTALKGAAFAADREQLEKSGAEVLKVLGTEGDKQLYQDLHWTGSMEEYLGLVKENPDLMRTSMQRMYDMIMAEGVDKHEKFGHQVRHYKFFDDPHKEGKDAIFGLDPSLSALVDLFNSGANLYGTQKRIILLRGPVGSSKSTIAALFKEGLERYSKTPEGALYTFGFQMDLENEDDILWAPMNEQPLYLLPDEYREPLYKELGLTPDNCRYPLDMKGDVTPTSRHYFEELMAKYEGDVTQVMKHIKIKRYVISEKDRIGIGTFTPKDEKNQDSTELTGDVNLRKLAEYGVDSDPRAFSFDGEFCVANRGMIEMVEMLKLDVNFLYMLLNASQEREFKPKKFALTHLDTVIIGHTNEPEYEKLQSNPFMEALRDRSVVVDIPYVTTLKDEIKVYEKDFNPDSVKLHIAPHTIEMAAMFAVLSRLEDPSKAELDRVQKMKLYNGKAVDSTDDAIVPELRKEAKREGLGGISPRTIQDTLSAALVKASGEGKGINAFMVLKLLDRAIEKHPLLTTDSEKEEMRELNSQVFEEYKETVKKEVQMAIGGDEGALTKLYDRYTANVKAYLRKEKVKDNLTGKDQAPDEKYMRSVEDKMGVNESMKDDYRRTVMENIGAMAVSKKTMSVEEDSKLAGALQKVLFDLHKDTVNLRTAVSVVKDPEAQKQIDIIKARLVDDYGYDEQSASDVIAFVGSIFARGDAANDEDL